MRRVQESRAFILIWIIAIVMVLGAQHAFAANNPGHDSLYVLKIGDNMTGNLNLTGNLTAFLVQVPTRLFGPNLDIQANGSPGTGTNNFVATTTDLKITSSGIIYLADSGGTVVQAGTGSQTVKLNVSGDIYSRNTLVCLANGTNCVGTGSSNLTLAQIATNMGNWSADKPNYATLAQLNAGVGQNLTYALINTNMGNASKHVGNCGPGTVIQNITATGTQCVAASGLDTNSGYTQWQLGSNTGTTSAITNNTIVNITGDGSTITTTKTVNNITIRIPTGGIGVAQIAAAVNTSYDTRYATLAQLTAAVGQNLTYALITTANGNWSLDKPNYATLAQLNAGVGQNLTYALINTNMGNASKHVGNCAAGTVVMNITAAGIQCVAASGGGGNTTGSGIATYVPKWTNSTNLVPSLIRETGTTVEVNGTLTVNNSIITPSGVIISYDGTATTNNIQGIAIGESSIGTRNSIAIGGSTNTSDDRWSVALGYGASTTSNYQFALGSESYYMDTITWGNISRGTRSTPGNGYDMLIKAGDGIDGGGLQRGGHLILSAGTDVDALLGQVVLMASTAVNITASNLLIGNGGTGNIYLGGTTSNSRIYDAPGDLTLDSDTAKTIIAEDLQINGNDLLDSGGALRLTLGATGNYNGSFTVNGSATRFTVNSSASTGSVVFGNTTGSTHLFVNGNTGNIGIGTSASYIQLQAYGAGQSTKYPTVTTTTTIGGTIAAVDSGSLSDNGGMMLFGANQGYFAAIKGSLYDGASNTQGDLSFLIRNSTTTTTLTPAMSIRYTGNVGINTTLPAQTLTVDGEIGNTRSVYLATTSGNVGINTTNPSYPLHVNGKGYFANTVGVAGATDEGEADFAIGSRVVENSSTMFLKAGPEKTYFSFNNQTNMFSISTYTNSVGYWSTLNLMNGTVRIGTGTPGNATGSYSLYVTGSIEYDTNLYGSGADVAELIDASEPLEAGDVVVADETANTTVKRSMNAYNTAVLGVISTNPSIILSKSDGDLPLALSGRVPIKASAENGPILPGDLLTTSTTPGHAMRCASRQECQGALVAKALAPLESGTGTITALVMLG